MIQKSGLQTCTRLFAAMWASSAPLAASSVTVNITPDPKACVMASLPKWKEPGMFPGGIEWHLGEQCDLDFRSFDGGVFVGQYCSNYGSPVYSPSKYAVYFGTGRIRKATDAEWDGADPYLNFRVPAINLGLNPRPEQKLIYKGAEYPKTGAKWPFTMDTSRLSPDGAFVAVNSWDGVIHIVEPPMIGYHEFNGRYYVDIYQVASAQRLLAIQGEFHGVFPHELFTKSAWISKRYYTLPLDDRHTTRRFVICDIGRVSH